MNDSNGVTVGRVFARSVDVIRANPVATLGTSFLLMALPGLIASLAGAQLTMLTSWRSGMYAGMVGYGLVIGLLWLIASGALVHATVAHDQGRQASMAEGVRIGIARCLPLAAVYILFFLGVWIGTLLLVVPGIWLAVRWGVALPAVVAERTGVFGAFTRSSDLTRGARWHVFGIMLLATIVYVLIVFAIGILTTAGSGSLAALAGGRAVPTTSLVGQIVQSVVSTVVITWFTTVGASLFVELRHWKDGPDADRLSDIFA